MLKRSREQTFVGPIEVQHAYGTMTGAHAPWFELTPCSWRSRGAVHRGDARGISEAWRRRSLVAMSFGWEEAEGDGGLY